MTENDSFSVRWLRRLSPIADGRQSLSEAEFNQLALELFREHHAGNAVYRSWCRSQGLSPESVDAWTRIPAIPVDAFRHYDCTVLPAAARQFTFVSSGTTDATRSRLHHSESSLEAYHLALWMPFRRQVLAPFGSPRERIPGRVLSLCPSVDEAPQSSLVHMIGQVRHRMQAVPWHACGEHVPGLGWCVDVEATLNALDRAQAGGDAVLILGTAFLFVHLLDALETRRLRFALPTGSRVMETGGYKGRSRELSVAELHGRLREQLGLVDGAVIREYGMCELASQAYDRTAGEPGGGVFRFPAWVRTRIRCPETGREVAEGESGVLEIVDLAGIAAVPAIRTADLAVRRKDGFDLLGRIASSPARGCSWMAA